MLSHGPRHPALRLAQVMAGVEQAIQFGGAQLRADLGLLTQQQLNEIGRVDVVMVPVDGGVTLDFDGMAEVLQALKAPLMIPMHYFSTYSLRRFVDKLGEKSIEVEFGESSSIVVSKTTLPTNPKLMVLPGRAF
jgi:L-ascorbate metabolism protein UlaG (beta-lactamase superfamily)